MMDCDMCGAPTTFGPMPDGAAEAIMERWNATILGLLSHHAETPARLAETMAAAPHFALGHACRGLFCLLLARREMVDAARDASRAAHEAAQALDAPLDRREALFVSALDAWLAGRPTVALDHLEAAQTLHPRDALAMKLVQSIRFILGDGPGMRASLERIAGAWDADHPARGYFDGCLAFALEETGDYVRAEQCGRTALERAPDDAWGLHAVAHVHDMTGQSARGLDWLLPRQEAWAHCNNFRYHVWWHAALMYLDQGRHDEVLRLYDETIRADRTDDYRDISNAASLLGRLELEGRDVGDRWDELAALSEGRTQDGCLAFADLHYMLALVGGERWDAAADLLGRMARDAASAGTDAQEIVRVPGLGAAHGLQAFGEGRFETAFAHLSAHREAMPRVGGSHAQRDVFERLTVEAALRAGRPAEALAMLDQRRALRGAEDRFSRDRRALIGRLGSRDSEGRDGARGAGALLSRAV